MIQCANYLTRVLEGDARVLADHLNVLYCDDSCLTEEQFAQLWEVHDDFNELTDLLEVPDGGCPVCVVGRVLRCAAYFRASIIHRPPEEAKFFLNLIDRLETIGAKDLKDRCERAVVEAKEV